MSKRECASLKAASGTSEKQTLYCSFCGKSQHEVRKLVAGTTVFICEECIVLCETILREENIPQMRDEILQDELRRKVEVLLRGEASTPAYRLLKVTPAELSSMSAIDLVQKFSDFMKIAYENLEEIERTRSAIETLDRKMQADQDKRTSLASELVILEGRCLAPA